MSEPPAAPSRRRRAPKQQRSQEIVRAILEAGRDLLERDGADVLTTNRIAERAGVSIGSLYRYFPNKEAVIGALYDSELGREVRDLEPQVEHPFEDTPLRESLVALVDFQLDRHRRLLDIEDDYYRDHHRDFSLARSMGPSEVESGIRSFLEQHADEVRVRNLDQAAYLVARGVSAILHATLDESAERLSEPAFREELIDLLVAYVTAPR